VLVEDSIRQKNEHTLVVNEIFHSVQGESSHTGRPCVFVRLAYCNLRCSYCDTGYAFTVGREMSVDEILDSVRSYDCQLVEVTGGEPLFQLNVHELMMCLCDEGFEVLLETSGSIDINGVDPRVMRIVDFKCPSSGMSESNLWQNVEHLGRADEVKFVIGDRDDYDWAKHVIEEHKLIQRCGVLMSPVFSALEPVQLVEWILTDKLNVRFQMQIHKYIWSPETRGV
jgi:7-carboxy-7-deazaguanine synthase